MSAPDSAAVDLPDPPWRKARKQGAVKRSLDQDGILAAAMRILDSEGLTAVSMRRVAADLDTGAASLYAHFANKTELLELMLDRTIAEVQIPVPDPARWQEQIRDVARSMQQTYGRHNDIALVAFASVPTGPNSLRIAEGLLAIMIAGGVPPQAAAWTLDRLSLFVLADAYEGSLYQLRARQNRVGGPSIQEYFEAIKKYFMALPAAQFPQIVDNVEALMSGDGDERFEFGLDLMIRGLASYVES